MNSALFALIIEDDPADFVILKRLFRSDDAFRYVWTKSLGEGLKQIEQHAFDIALLDLTLQDSSGIATVEAFVKDGRLPVVVLSGMDNEETALQSVQYGAQEYLVKGTFDTALLVRTIRHAIERHKLRRELDATREQVQHERELRRLQADVSTSRSPSDTSSHATIPLKQSHPEDYSIAVNEYAGMLEKSLEQRGFKVEHNVTSLLRNLAQRLGAQEIAPRDVIDIHKAAIERKSTNSSPEKKRFVTEEARYLLVGMLGHLCSFYRRAYSKQVSGTLSDMASQAGTDHQDNLNG